MIPGPLVDGVDAFETNEFSRDNFRDEPAEPKPPTSSAVRARGRFGEEPERRTPLVFPAVDAVESFDPQRGFFDDTAPADPEDSLLPPPRG